MGCRSFRLYEMFMGPLEAVKPWQTKGIGGVHRFLSRFWRLAVDSDGELSQRFKLKLSLRLPAASAQNRQESDRGHRSSPVQHGHLGDDGAAQRGLQGGRDHSRVAGTLVRLLSPFAPHLAEEIWSHLGHRGTLAYEPWPEYQTELVQEETFTISIPGERKTERHPDGSRWNGTG